MSRWTPRWTAALALVVGAFSGLLAVDAVAGSATPCGGRFCSPAPPAPPVALAGNGYVATLTGAHRLAAAGFRTTASGSRIAYDLFVACEPGQPDTGPLCAAATQTCKAEGQGYLRFNVRESTDGGATWKLVQPSVCMGPNDVVALAQVVADAQDAIRRLNLGQPHIAVNPPVATYVNIPTIFHATAQGPRAIALTVDDVTLTLQVAPRWRWDFGDGTALDADTPGIGYDDTSPTGDPAHYPVLHTYTDHGQVHVGLTVTWTGTFTITGAAGAHRAPTKTYQDARSLPVRQATATITGNG